MAELARNPDYLKSHVSLNRRVTNLETGVHPTAADVSYWDSYGPATITKVAGWSDVAASPAAQWKRRTGHVYLFGKVQRDLTGIDPEVGATLGTLPPEARPDETELQIAACTKNPFYVRVQVSTGGVITIFPPDAAMGTTEIGLDNIAYSVG